MENSSSAYSNNAAINRRRYYLTDTRRIDFFYVCLQGQSSGSSEDDHGGGSSFARIANYVVGLYGIQNFIADVDRNREFWRDGDHVVSACLDYLANEGFKDFFADVDIDFKNSAHEFRQRHSLNLLKSLNGN